MGAISKASQEKKNTFAGLIKAVGPQLQAVMPRGFKAERLAQMAIAAYTRTPKLMDCDQTTILQCCLQCAALGLEPSAVDGLGRAYILPYWNTKAKRYDAQFQLGKNGMLELVQRSGMVSSIRTQCVYEGDEFSYWEDETGVHFRYEPSLDSPHDAASLRLVYLTCHMTNGGFAFLQMSKPEIDAIRARSKSKDREGNVTGPWATDYEAMAEKTVLRRAFNRGLLPRSVEAASGVSADESTPVVLDADGYEVFGHDGSDATEVEAEVAPAGVDPVTGEVTNQVVKPAKVAK